MKETQKKLGDLLRANSEEIKKIDNVLSSIKDENAKADLKKVEETNKSKIKKKCKHFNSGHCKYKRDCKF